MNTEKLPLLLKVVAWLFILWGVIGIIAMIVSFALGFPGITDGILAVFAGRGLLRLRRGWYLYAVAYTGVVLIGTVILLGYLALHVGVTIPVRAGGAVIGHLSYTGSVILTVLIGLYFFWQLWAFMRPAIRHLFTKPSVQP